MKEEKGIGLNGGFETNYYVIRFSGESTAHVVLKEVLFLWYQGVDILKINVFQEHIEY